MNINLTNFNMLFNTTYLRNMATDVGYDEVNSMKVFLNRTDKNSQKTIYYIVKDCFVSNFTILAR